MGNQEPLEVILITGRTIEQGCSLEGGKMTDEFIKAAGFVNLIRRI